MRIRGGVFTPASRPADSSRDRSSPHDTTTQQHSPRGNNGEPQNTAIALAMAVKFGVDSGAVHADGNNFISGTLSLSEAF